MSGSIDKTGIPTTNNGNTENGYSVEITDYVYNKISSVDNDGDFTNAEIEEYDLDVSNDKINISTTGKLIKYLKSFAKVCSKEINNKLNKSEYYDYVDEMEVEVARLDNRISSLADSIYNNIYPVGSIYMSFESTDPSELFGGTWTKLQNRFLYGSGSKTVGTTDGEENHKLSINEMPIHTHTQNSHLHYSPLIDEGYKFLVADGNIIVNGTHRNVPSSSKGEWYFVYNVDAADIGEVGFVARATATNNNTGGGASHNNMPPYVVVHMWRRLS